MDNRIDAILALFREHGHSAYGHEAVDQLQHALQTATLARRAGATPELVAAALLHDVGHLLHDLPDHAPDEGVDDLHERLGAEYASRWFRPEVAEPVRLHVEAKRYLCTVEPGYLGQLSEPSVTSLYLQGGLMTDQEIRAFEALPFHQDAVRLRRWDDLAKDPEMKTEALEAFVEALEAGLR